MTDRGTDGGAMVEVAHEALFRERPRLRDWTGERGEDLRPAEAATGQRRSAGGQAGHLGPHERRVCLCAAQLLLGTT